MTILTVVLSGLLLAAPAPAQSPTPPAGDRPVLHVVLFALDDPSDADTLIADCRRLLPGIPGVEAVWVGRKALDDRDDHIKDYAVGLTVRFRRLSDLAPYGSHPRHLELVQGWRAKARWRVIDFFAE